MRRMTSMTISALSMVPGIVCAAPNESPKPNLAKQQWNGNAICYSGYRTGHNPGKGIFPTKAQILEDLKILNKNWKLIRIYGADQHSRDVMEVIRDHRLQLKVLLGTWLSGSPGGMPINDQQIEAAIKLANEFPETVVAVNVGNEALVSWSDHKLTEPQIIEYVERVRKGVTCPISVADDFLYWIQPGNKLVDHIDFITLHAYPIWGRADIEHGVPGTIESFGKIRNLYPTKTIVLGEVGWATYTVGPQHAPKAGTEEKAKRFYLDMNAWSKKNGVTTFIFEAFDEPWKGNGTEGHWGLFSEDRKAKLAMIDLYPELKPTKPTSPSYDEPAAHQAEGRQGAAPAPAPAIEKLAEKATPKPLEAAKPEGK